MSTFFAPTCILNSLGHAVFVLPACPTNVGRYWVQLLYLVQMYREMWIAIRWHQGCWPSDLTLWCWCLRQSTHKQKYTIDKEEWRVGCNCKNISTIASGEKNLKKKLADLLQGFELWKAFYYFFTDLGICLGVCFYLTYTLHATNIFLIVYPLWGGCLMPFVGWSKAWTKGNIPLFLSAVSCTKKEISSFW